MWMCVGSVLVVRYAGCAARVGAACARPARHGHPHTQATVPAALILASGSPITPFITLWPGLHEHDVCGVDAGHRSATLPNPLILLPSLRCATTVPYASRAAPSQLPAAAVAGVAQVLAPLMRARCAVIAELLVMLLCTLPLR